MGAACGECGASQPAGAECRRRLDRLLEIETRVLPTVADPERAKRAHYFAVATYQAQHPSQVTIEALETLVLGLTEMAGPHPRPVQQLFGDARSLAAGFQRVRRRALAGDRLHVPDWPTRWTMTARDVGERPEDDYLSAVEEWARSAVADLARARLVTARPDGKMPWA